VDDLYDVRLRLTGSGDFPRDDLLFGYGQVRSTNGDVCSIDMEGIDVEVTCEDQFSSDGGFTLSLDAFSGRLPD
jgi:hypothetical protein